jgi:hypothetical protein
MQRCRGFPTIGCADLDQDIIGGNLRVFNEHVEITVIIEHAGVDQFVLWIGAASLTVRGYQIVVWKRALRILVEVLQVRIGGGGVEVKVVLFDVLAVVAFAVG